MQQPVSLPVDAGGQHRDHEKELDEPGIHAGKLPHPGSDGGVIVRERRPGADPLERIEQTL